MYNVPDNPIEAAQTARELGEIFSGEATEYFGEDDTPTHSLAAISPMTPLPLVAPRKKLLDYAPKVPQPPARVEFSNPDLPIYIICTVGIEKYFFKYNAFPNIICIHKSRFEELVNAIACIHKEPFRPNYMPFAYGIQVRRHEYIPIVFNNQLPAYTAICLTHSRS